MFGIARIESKMICKKTVSFSILHLGVVFLVIWLLTGSPFIGGAAAIVEPALSSLVYFFHEKVWQRFSAKSSVESDYKHQGNA